MKANELRIGNYVNGGIVQSLPMHQGEMYAVLIQSEFHSFGTPKLMEDIKPILLTEKWLLDFGFDGLDLGKYTLILSNGNFFSLSCEEPIAINIKYVHQLQNLYFALTNKELKIE